MTLPALGIDVAKLKFDLCLIDTEGKLRHKQFPNTAVGFAQLDQWLTKQKVGCVQACMEATGAYGEALAYHLHAAGHRVSVQNPAAVKAPAASRLSRAQTDRVDAELIARFCIAQEPPAWAPPAREVRDLQALARRLGSLVEVRGMESNRLAALTSAPAVQTSVEEHIAYLDREIERTEALTREHVNTHPGLRRQSELLDSIPGIAATTAAVILAQIVDAAQCRGARQVAAYAGLVPREHRSGSSARGRPRLSKVGNARLRKALYFPAVTALRCSELFKRWAAGLRERGKCKMSVIGAAMRKLIHLAYGVLKTGKPFDPEWAKSA